MFSLNSCYFKLLSTSIMHKRNNELVKNISRDLNSYKAWWIHNSRFIFNIHNNGIDIQKEFPRLTNLQIRCNYLLLSLKYTMKFETFWASKLCVLASCTMLSSQNTKDESKICVHFLSSLLAFKTWGELKFDHRSSQV